ncbi:MAG: regulatory protein TetR [Rhodoglobus sp.]|jgi:AcrR family transcriptional regulator|nr:regulatory protein TetR [Rhodoglobus sp.]
MIILFYRVPMPRVTDEYRSAKRDEIATAAMAAFRRKGFQATSMADIIAESGLSAGAIYGHYRSKSELVIDVASRVVGSRVGEVEALATTEAMPSPAHLVRVLMSGMLQDMGSASILVQLWGEAVTDPTIKRLAVGVIAQLHSVYSGYISLWHQREHGLSPAVADALGEEQTDIFVGSAQGYILQSALLKDFDSEAYLASIEKYLPR